MDEATKKVIDSRMDNIGEVTKHIVPNPKCRASGCNGLRGYNGIQIGKDGLPQLMLCCGTVGGTEYARIASRLDKIEKVAMMTFDMNKVGHDAVFRATFFGGIRWAFGMLMLKLGLRKDFRDNGTQPD